MGYGSKIAKTKPSLGPKKSGCFSGGASKNGSIEKFYPSQSQDMILGGQGPSKTDPKNEPKPTPAETAKSINKFSKSVYDAGYSATRGRGGYGNVDGTSLGFERGKTKPGLPKGVFQDYLGSGGNKNPRVAKDILSKAAKSATSETGMKNFVKPNAHSYDRAHYSPTEQFRGVDTQTGKEKTFMSMGYTPEVTKHSDAFRENMKFGISRSGKTAQEGNEIKQKGLVNAPKPKASVLEKGPNKGIHSSKSYGINKILGDLDNSGDLSGYEAKRQAAIEKNMSKGSTKIEKVKSRKPSKEMAKSKIEEGKKLKKEGRQEKRDARKDARKAKRSARLDKKIALQEFKGKQKLKSGDKLGAKAKQDRIANLKARKAKK